MAQYSEHFTGRFDDLIRYLDESVADSSLTGSFEGGNDMACGGVRCAVRVYERYSYLGSNRLSLSVTVFGQDGDIQLTAVTSGGSQAMFFKINTWGEEAFLDKFRRQMDAYKAQNPVERS